jgi:hypothetical protein
MSRREQDALLALFNSFRPSRRVTTFDQLSDGKVLLEVGQICTGRRRPSCHVVATEHALGSQR